MQFYFKIFYLLIGFLFIGNCYGQEIANDTIFIKKTVHTEKIEIDTLIIKGGISPAETKVLIGTTFLPYSNKMIGLLNKGIEPISLNVVEECNQSVDPELFVNYPQFIKVERDSNELTIDVSVIANCCHEFLGEAEVLNDDTLNLIYTSYGGFCTCSCVFTLRFIFNTEMESNYNILKFVKINNSVIKAVIPSP